MFDLGKYAGEILASWGITLALLLVLIVVTWRRAVVVKRALDEAEKRASNDE